MGKVSIVKCENYEGDNVKNAIKKSLDLIGGLPKFVKPGNTVLLKVNAIIGFPPERAATTHPAVVRAMVELVREAGGSRLWGTVPALLALPDGRLRCAVLQKLQEIQEQNL